MVPVKIASGHVIRTVAGALLIGSMNCEVVTHSLSTSVANYNRKRFIFCKTKLYLRNRVRI